MGGSTPREIDATKLPKVDFDFANYRAWRKPEAHFAVEIGCGVGLHPITWARANPAGQILAVERTSEKFAKFAGRVAHHPTLTNLWPAHSEAAVLLPQILAPNEVDCFFYLYPNPEPKAANRRLGQSPLLKFIFSTLKPAGQLVFATNIEFYAKELVARAKAVGFSKTEATVVASTTKPRTHFEKKYLERGDTCHNMILFK